MNVGYKGNGGGIDAEIGAVTVVNSILYGNTINTNHTANFTGHDLYAASGASISISHTLVTATNSTYCSAAADGGITFGDGMLEGDPLFMTNSVTCDATVYAPTLSVDPWSINIHLQSKVCYVDETTGGLVRGKENSPAIDAGAKGYSYANEPSPNGSRINLGCYGNTPYASMSPGRGFYIIVR